MNARASENYMSISRSSSASKSVEIFFWAEIYWGRLFLRAESSLIQSSCRSFIRVIVPYEISKVNFRVETKMSCQYVRRDLIDSLTRQQTWYSGSACWYFRYHINSHPDNIYIQWPDGKGQPMNYNSQHKTLLWKIRRISQNHTLI